MPLIPQLLLVCALHGIISALLRLSAVTRLLYTLIAAILPRCRNEGHVLRIVVIHSSIWVEGGISNDRNDRFENNLPKHCREGSFDRLIDECG